MDQCGQAVRKAAEQDGGNDGDGEGEGGERGDQGAEHPARAGALHLGQQALKKKPLRSNVYLKSRNEVTAMSPHL